MKQLQTLQVHRLHDVEGAGQHFVQPRSQGKGIKAGICDGVPLTAV